MREKFPKLVAKLSRQGFVVGQHQRRPTGLGNDISHRERLARARRPQQGLMALAIVHPRHQLLDRHRLITFGAVGGREIEGEHRLECRATKGDYRWDDQKYGGANKKK